MGNVLNDAQKYANEAKDAVGNYNYSSAWNSAASNVQEYANEAKDAVGNYNYSSAWDSAASNVNSLTNDTMDALKNNGTYIWDQCDPSKMTYILAPIGGFFDSVGEILKSVGMVVGWALLIFIVAVVLLQIVGFGSGGIIAGSCAAAWQSCIGNVVAGSCFAILQGCGAGFCNVYGLLIILTLAGVFSVISLIVICT